MEKETVSIPKEDLERILDKLLDIAEDFLPNYSSSNFIAEVDDFYKKYLD